MFQMLIGSTPFSAPTLDEIHANIMNAKIQWPIDHALSADAIDLIERLLTEDKEKRLGAQGIDDIQMHRWFDRINWEELAGTPAKQSSGSHTRSKFEQNSSAAETKHVTHETPNMYDDMISRVCVENIIRVMKTLQLSLGCGLVDGPDGGVHIVAIREDSCLELAGLQLWDVIVQVDRHHTPDLECFKSVIGRHFHPSDRVVFNVRRFYAVTRNI